MRRTKCSLRAGGGIRKSGPAIKNAAAGASFPSSVADSAAPPRGGNGLGVEINTSTQSRNTTAESFYFIFHGTVRPHLQS